jgi:hypothetical protein
MRSLIALSCTGAVLGIAVGAASLVQARRLQLEERQIENAVARPSIRGAGLSTTIRSITLRYLGGNSSWSPTYDIRFADDDTFVYNGFRDVPEIGIRRGRVRFALLAEWIGRQPISIAQHLDLGGPVDSPWFIITIERSRAPNAEIVGGLPTDDAEAWGILSVLQGAAFELLTARRPHPPL